MVSVFGLTTTAAWVFFCGEVVAFFGAGFEVTGCFDVLESFVVEVVFGLTCVNCFTHSRKVISSNAKSFPQPLGFLSIITSINVDVAAGVVKSARCCDQFGSSTLGNSPVTIFATTFPSVVSNRIFNSGNNNDPHFFVGLQRFMSHRPSS